MASNTAIHSAQPLAIPINDVLPWAVFAGLLLLLAIYFFGTEGGIQSMSTQGAMVHEFLHDGRHLLGFPCH